MSVGGFAVSAAINPADLEGSVIGLSGSIGGMSAGIEIANDADRSFDAALGTAIAGASVALAMTGDLDNTSSSALAYGLELGLSAMGSDLTVTMAEGGAISVSAAMGDLTLSSTLTDGDAFNSLKLVYDADLADSLNVAATLQGGDTTSLTVKTTLSF